MAQQQGGCGDERDRVRASLDADALRRLRLGQGRPEDHYLPAAPAQPLVVPVREYSRWRSGPTAFGPVGRLVASGLTLGVAWLVLSPLTVPVLVPLVVLVLRGVWHREPQPLVVLRDQRGREGRVAVGRRGQRDAGGPTARPR